MGKKVIAMLLCLFMAATILAACGNESAKNEPSNASTAAGSSAATAEATPEAKAEPIKVYYLHWMTPEDLPGDKLIEQKIIDETGIQPVCLTPAGGSQSEKLNILLASNEPIDLINGNWPDLSAKGAVIPLNDLLNQYGKELLTSFTDFEWATRTDKDGKIWGIPIANLPNGSGVRVRSDWMEKVGLPLPATLEEFEKLLEAFKTNEALGKDRIVMISSLEVNQLERSFAGLFCQSGTEDYLDTDGSVKPAVFNSGYKDFIVKMNEWYKKGYFWKDGFVQKYTVINDIVAQNRVGILATWSSVGIDGYIKLLDAGQNLEYLHMSKFTGPAGTAYTYLRPGIDAFMITSKSKNPEAAMKLANWYNANVDNKMTASIGLEGVHWEWIDKAKQIYKNLEVPDDKKYTGKFNYVQGGLHLSAWSDNNYSKAWMQDFAYGLDKNLDLKVPFDKNIIYDQTKIQNSVPAFSDLEKYRDENLTKFITGQRSMSEWDKFLSELMNIGYDKVIAEKTSQYNALK